MQPLRFLYDNVPCSSVRTASQAPRGSCQGLQERILKRAHDQRALVAIDPARLANTCSPGSLLRRGLAQAKYQLPTTCRAQTVQLPRHRLAALNPRHSSTTALRCIVLGVHIRQQIEAAASAAGDLACMAPSPAWHLHSESLGSAVRGLLLSFFAL